jgi:hypothetical protein
MNVGADGNPPRQRFLYNLFRLPVQLVLPYQQQRPVSLSLSSAKFLLYLLGSEFMASALPPRKSSTGSKSDLNRI